MPNVVEELARSVLSRAYSVSDQTKARTHQGWPLLGLRSRFVEEARVAAQLLPLDHALDGEAGRVPAAILWTGRIAIEWDPAVTPSVYSLSDERLRPHLIVLRDRLQRTLAQIAGAPVVGSARVRNLAMGALCNRAGHHMDVSQAVAGGQAISSMPTPSTSAS